jgi:hypothetical protein
MQGSRDAEDVAKRDLRALSTFTFGAVRDVVQSGMVLIAANHFFVRDPDRRVFAQNPANTLPYRALRAFQEQAIVHISEVLKPGALGSKVNVRRRQELRNHRDAVSHPIEVQWRRPQMQVFADEDRAWLDHRPCLVWDMHLSINEQLRAAGEEPELATVDATPAMATMLSSILRLSMRPGVQIPGEQELLEYLRRYAPKYIEQLERDLDGRVGDAAQPGVATDGASPRR